MHCMGEAVGEDPGRAVAWFRLSADLGYAPAQFSLGTMYSSGTDVERDLHEAMKWFLLAAVQGRSHHPQGEISQVTRPTFRSAE